MLQCKIEISVYKVIPNLSSIPVGLKNYIESMFRD